MEKLKVTRQEELVLLAGCPGCEKFATCLGRQVFTCHHALWELREHEKTYSRRIWIGEFVLSEQKNLD